MDTNKSEAIGPHVLVYYDQGGTNLHMNIEGLDPSQVLYVAALLTRHANRMLDYQELEASKRKSKLVLPS